MNSQPVSYWRYLTAFVIKLFLLMAWETPAQEPGEPVELALPAPLRSLKTVPVTEELIQLLENPYATPQRRRSFLFDTNGNEVPLPPLLLQPLNINPLTGEPMTLEYDPAEMESEISFAIPAEGDPAVNSAGRLQRVNPATGLLEEATLEPPENETEFIKDREAAIKLGKALFWDMQVGSDGVQACATCHFNAGIDSRVRNQLNPNHLRVNGALQENPDFTLQVKGPNQSLEPRDFPFHKLADITRPGEPLLNPGNVLSDANDVMSSMGVIFRNFVDIPTPGPEAFTAPDPFGVQALLPDIGTVVPDPVGGTNGPFHGLRRVEPRNTPTIFAAAFNFDNFWDGRARHDFNGGSVSGGADPAHHILVDTPAGLEATRELIKFSSIASLATGPPLSDFEMSFRGRFWAKIGKKLLQTGVVPLANQLVHPNDSVLGACSNQRETPGKPGINESYVELIQEAFEDELWSNTSQHLEWMPDPTDGFDGVKLVIADGPADPTNTSHFTQMEANMALFFGLAVQAFTQILIPDDTPFDRFLDANPVEFLGVGFVNDIDPNRPGVQVVGLTERQLHGFDLFSGQNHSGKNPQFKTARCGQCHVGPELTDHSVVTSHAFMLGDPFTGHPKVITGFLLEEEAGEKAQDAIEIENISFGYDFETGLSTFGQDVNGFPSGHSLFDNGIYNIGVRPILEDISRGGNDLFGFPLSLAALALQNMGVPVGTFSANPIYTVTPLYEYDQVFNQFTGEWELVLVPNPTTGVPEPVLLPAGVDIEFPPQLPDYYEPFANELPVGEVWPQIDRTTFIPDVISSNIAVNILPDGSYPNPNRVGRMGNFKAPQLRNVELTGPYFHNGGMLTLRQVIDFYGRGGDFPASNNEHRDPHILNLNVNFFSQLTESEKVALVDFLLALTDERVRFKRAPFDHPEIHVPINGTAPDNLGGRAWFLADARFERIPEVGAGGQPTPVPNFLNISSTPDPNGPDHFDSHTPFSSPNSPPVSADDAFIVAALAPNRLPAPGLLENDNDADADPMTAVVVSGPSANATLTLNPDGSFVYRYGINPPAPVTDSFTYKANDGTVNGNVATVTLTVNPHVFVSPVITWNTPADITYGTALSASQLNATADVPGTFAYSPPAGTVLNAGNNQTLTVIFTPTDDFTYSSATSSVPINVLQAQLTIAANNTNKVFGAPLPLFTATFTGFVNGDTPASLDTPVNLTTTANASSSVGFYPINAGGATDTNYTIMHFAGMLEVTRATPAISWSTPASIVEGTALSDTQLNAAANVPGAFVYDPAAGTVLPRGNGQLLKTTFTPTDPTNYNTVMASVTIDVRSVTPPPTGNTTLVARGAVWKYLDNGSDQGTAWRQTSYNDASWASGPAVLGYGDGDVVTTVGFGPDDENKYITTYFRRSFEIADPSFFERLIILLRRDDGAVVYVNGVEVFRSNMPTGTIGYRTVAASSGDNDTFFSNSVPASPLVAGVNVIAVEVHQRSGSSSDILFDLQLIATPAAVIVNDTTPPAAVTDLRVAGVTHNSANLGWTAPGDDGTVGTASSYDVRYSTMPINDGNFASATQATSEPAPAAAGTAQSLTIGGLSANTMYYFALKSADERNNISPLSNVPTATTSTNPPSPPPPPRALIAENATWKYLDNGSDQGTAWRGTSFDDSTWGSGPAQLGYGDGDEATTVGFGPDANNKYITTYFRHSFNVADPSAFTSLLLEILRDDGAVVYLNGTEVFRSNMPGGTVNYLTAASSAVPDAEENAYQSTSVSPSLLLAGLNVVAVEVHQANGSSSDISFNLKLGLGPTNPPTGLPAPWLNQDIGSVGLAGSATFSSGVFTVNGAGSDISSSSDRFHFVFQAASGNCEIIAKVTTVENTSSSAKAGVMIRETLASNSKNVFMALRADNRTVFQRRTSTGGSTSSSSSSASTPYWVRLVRSGNTFTAFRSSNGTSWSQVGSTSISMSSNVYIGLGVTSRSTSNLNTSTFESVTATP